MEQTKHKSLPFKETVEAKKILGKKVLTKDGKDIGKIKAIHIHPTQLTVEGIHVDTGLFYVDQYIDENYIKSLSEEGAVLKINPATNLINLIVYDSLGKKVGRVKNVNRSKLTNTLRSITVDLDGEGHDFVINADYIAMVGDNIMLKEPFMLKKKSE
jgi:sporulation protein YlmC with PRC-barrel domain